MPNHKPKRFIHLLALAMFIAALADIPFSPSAALAQSAACSQSVFVQAGETLSTIAARILGNSQAYQQIVTATNAAAAMDAGYARIDNPNVIAVGWKLCIPGSSATPQAATPTSVGGSVTEPAAGNTTSISDTITSDQMQEIEEQWAKRMASDGPHPLTIEYLREQTYPGSPITIEQTLAPTGAYSRYLVSYISEGLKIEAYMTVPLGEKPATGWPVIIFNHGYIPPQVYSPLERYIAYQDAFASNGYIVLRPDYRGNANSEGEASGAYGDPGYTIDVLNAVSSIKAYPDADPNRLGMWGHSMGGYITARVMVVRTDIKAGVIWGGVIGSYIDMMRLWHAPAGTLATIPQRHRGWRQVLIRDYGTPEENPAFWASISANSYLKDLSGPIQLDHSTTDEEVPLLFSQNFYTETLAAGKPIEFYTYPGDNHNISGNLSLALQRSVAFFDKYVKNAPPTITPSPISATIPSMSPISATVPASPTISAATIPATVTVPGIAPTVVPAPTSAPTSASAAQE